ncbi:ABC transporter ATP-binding protein [Halobaculum limi]|uniref:ABC transporter ATP-binding protein n=1 Tax=Halobaculum limi TaxID=3031916 RepID=UPI002406B477|nr:ABC transporter ATP-binding protein [Halobaculum sp. YSMS11]
MSDDEPLVVVEDLTRHYPVRSGVLGRQTGSIRAVDGVSFTVDRGEALGLVGESGCGKSTVAETLVHLDDPTSGTVRFDGQTVTGNPDALADLRRRTATVFQDPADSLDPRMPVGESAAEPLAVHGVARERRRERVKTLFERVGLSADHRERYPHELSGGQQRRVSVARALALDPEFLVLDEPTAALDVSVQAEILALLDDLRAAFDLSMLFISHDMSVIRRACDRVAVMYAGELVETGPTAAVLDDPDHPYTRALTAAVPTPDPRAGRPEHTLTGAVPDLADPPDGCRFHTRCPEVIPPEGTDLTSEEYAAVIAFREAVADDVVAVERRGGDTDGTAAAIREEYDLPDPDGEAGDALSTAVEAAADGDTDRALAALRGSFDSVCVRESPERADTDRSAACHLTGDRDEAGDAASDATPNTHST